MSPCPDPDSVIVRKQYALSQAAYAKRAEAVSRIPNFWPLVLEQAPPDIDQYIQPNDSRILGENLLSIQVSRLEIEGGANGNPRSVRSRFDFKTNDDFEDAALEKTFWYRRASDGWTGLVSEPVRIRWKKGKDLTEGLTDASVALWEARKKVGDMMAKGVPEYGALRKKVEHWHGMNTSFFTWFGSVSGRRWVSAEESEKANAEYRARKEARRTGSSGTGTAPDEEAEEQEANDDQAVEVHQAGEDLAVSFSEDVWPNAIKYFTQAQEMDDMSDAEFEDGLEEEDDEEDEEDGDDAPVDIRSLVQEKSGKKRANGEGGSASKKAKR